MSDSGAGRVPRRYGEAEVVRILERATELQEARVDSVPGSGLTLDELAEAAREVGIDPAIVRRVAAELEGEFREATPASRLAGGPLRLRIERKVEGELPPNRFEDVLLLVRRATGDEGVATLTDRTLTWRTGGAGELARRWVALHGEDGYTVITWEEKLANLAGALYGGLGLGVGAGLGAGAAAPLLTAGMTALGIGAPLVIAGGCLGLARSIYSRTVRRHEATARETIDRIALLVEPPR